MQEPENSDNNSHIILTNQPLKAILTKIPSHKPKEHPMALTKADIVAQLTNHLGFTKKQASDTTETLLEIIVQKTFIHQQFLFK